MTAVPRAADVRDRSGPGSARNANPTAPGSVGGAAPGGAPDGPQAGGPGTARGSQPRHLIVTVYGLYSRAEGGWMSISSLISLLADLGVDEPAVRSSISRLKRREILHASRRDGVAGYALSDTALAILREGDHRIFRRERARLADGWLLAVFSVPEPQREKRHVLRSQLSRLGFGTAAPGVWVAPAYLQDATADMLARLGLRDYADLFHADHLAFGDLSEKVGAWWDLAEIERLARAFVAAHQPALGRWRRRQPSSHPRAAFADHIRVLTDWRRLPYLDPGLPAELLPPDWAGTAAAEVFFSLRSLLADAAQAHVNHTISP